MIREHGVMVLAATLLHEQGLRKSILIAPMAPVEVFDGNMNVSTNSLLDRAREVNRSEQFSGDHRRKHNLTHLLRVPWCTICCGARSIDDPHPAVICDGTFDSLRQIARYQDEGDTTPMTVLLLVQSSTGYLGATDVDQSD